MGFKKNVNDEYNMVLNRPVAKGVHGDRCTPLSVDQVNQEKSAVFQENGIFFKCE